MKSVKFLDKVAEVHQLKNDNQIAVFMQWPNGTVSNYRSGRRIMDNEACIALALALEIDPVEIIRAADMDRAERAGKTSLWEFFPKEAPVETEEEVVERRRIELPTFALRTRRSPS